MRLEEAVDDVDRRSNVNFVEGRFGIGVVGAEKMIL